MNIYDLSIYLIDDTFQLIFKITVNWFQAFLTQMISFTINYLFAHS